MDPIGVIIGAILSICLITTLHILDKKYWSKDKHKS
jgi:hypothetical protein